jgi:hypothetical protein
MKWKLEPSKAGKNESPIPQIPPIMEMGRVAPFTVESLARRTGRTGDRLHSAPSCCQLPTGTDNNLTLALTLPPAEAADIKVRPSVPVRTEPPYQKNIVDLL